MPSAARAQATASLIEVFVSFQGEGPKVGQPTLFVRGAGCPLRCTYCDTVESYEAPATFEVRGLHGARVAAIENPVTARDVFDSLPRREWKGPRWLAFTGGEPLLFPEFGRELFGAARASGLRTLLETAAIDASALTAMLPATDHLAMDWKLPTTLHGRAATERAHEHCLAAAVEHGVETSVKLVLTPGVTDAEWHGALARLGRFRARVTLVLQPVTPCLDELAPLPAERLLAMARHALDEGFDILVLPQVHKHLGLA